MKNKICIYTAIFGDYEILRDPLYIDDSIDYICFTDNKTLVSKVWDIRVVTNNDNVSNAVFYKKFKCLPHKYLKQYNYTIWLDANFVINSPYYIKYIFTYLKNNQIALYTHFSLEGNIRKCIYEEAKVSRKIKKYKDDNIDLQAETYFREGYPRQNGLYQSGFLLRNNKDDQVSIFNQLWYDEICKYGKQYPQCQISLPYCLWKSNLHVDVIQDNIYDYEMYDVYNHKHTDVIFNNCIIEELKDRTKRKPIKHIIVFGNDHTINDFNFDQLKGTDLVTIGINRLWKKYDCDYLYFMDKYIVRELNKCKISPKTVLLHPLYLFDNQIDEYETFKKDYKKVKLTNNLRQVLDYEFPHQSLTWCMYALENEVFPQYKCKFYIYGVSLKWDDKKHHFWVGDKDVYNKKDGEYYNDVFDLYLKGLLQFLKTTNSEVISVSKDSRINQNMRYEDINDIINRRTLNEKNCSAHTST